MHHGPEDGVGTLKIPPASTSKTLEVVAGEDQDDNSSRPAGFTRV